MVNLEPRKNRHKKEILYSALLIGIAAVLLVGALILDPIALQEENLRATFGGLFENLSYAIIVALLVRWTIVWLKEFRPVDHIYRTNGDELNLAIRNAKQKIWILETWFTRDGTANVIMETGATDIKIVSASFRDEEPENKSPVFARLVHRGITVDLAKSKVEGSISRFADEIFDVLNLGVNDIKKVRFNAKHNPAFIYILDDEVYWGPYPIDVDAQEDENWIQKVKLSEPESKFWERQFCHAWEHSHSYAEETKHNSNLRSRA